MKKIVIDGVEYIQKDAETPEEVVEEVEETTEEVEEVVEAPETEKEVEDKIEKAAESVVASLGLEKLTKSIEELKSSMADTSGDADDKVKDLLDFETLMKKDVKSMTSDEKIVGFFQAMVQSNHSVLKALSEGTAADGGYLFPDEFRAEIIRDIAEMPSMRKSLRLSFLLAKFKLGELLGTPRERTISSQALPVMA